MEALQELGDVLTHLLYRATGEESNEKQTSLSFHLKACLSFVAILVLELAIPPVNSMNFLPLSLRECVGPLAMDECIALVYPSVRERLTPYLSAIQPNQSEVAYLFL